MSAPRPIWAVGVIGSCRVHTPLQKAAAAGLLEYRLDAAIGFLHNPVEIRQALALYRAQRVAPEPLCAMMNVSAPAALGHSDRWRRLFLGIDALVVEISSLRIIAYEGWQLQIQRFREHMQDAGFTPAEVSDLFKPGWDRDAFLRRAEPHPLLADILRHGSFYELDEAGLEAALRALNEEIGAPTLYVGIATHWAGKPIAQRVMLDAALARLAAEAPNAGYLAPTSFVGEDARDWMKDPGHYHPETEPRAGRAIAAAVERFGATSRTMLRLREKRLMRAAMQASVDA